jgi:hypothetical protein
VEFEGVPLVSQTPESNLNFVDNFESNDLYAWTVVAGT